MMYFFHKILNNIFLPAFGHFQVDALIQGYKNTNVVKQCHHHFIIIKIIFDPSHPDIILAINQLDAKNLIL